ncbi:MAG TPA: PIN domain-containing protein [Planctomycetota bacterium]|jgi:predicted nucleic acid-binding protein
MKVLLDTNVLLDVLLNREPFYADAAKLWSLAETGKIHGCVSALSFTNVYYVARHHQGALDARQMLRKTRDIFTTILCDAQIVNQAIDSDISDFEDAVQYFSSVHTAADCIITRNKRDFPKDAPPALTPHEFLATYSFE